MKKLLLFSALAFFAGGAGMAQCPSGQVPVTVSISTDAYGSETTWTLTGPGGSPSYGSGGPYANHNTAGSFAQTPVSICVPEGATLVFTIHDAYGDGMCCSYGEGHYEVNINGCTTVAAGGEFTTSQTTTFTATPAAALDLAMISVDLPVVLEAGPVQISGQVKNLGATTISSYDLNYSVDNGATQTQSISTPINSCSTYNFTHGTVWNAGVGAHTVMVWVSNVNGSTDGNSDNDSMTKNVSIATQTVPRVVTVEEFGSSTCPPCATFDVTFSPMLNSFNTNEPGSSVAAIEYHMNWPSPGNDHSYNPDGNTRRGYYGVTGIPSPWVDGHEMNGVAADINNALSVPAFINLDVSYTLSGNDVAVTANVTPHFDAPAGYKLYIAITEDHYVDPASTTSQSNFHYSMRKMLPNGNGTSLAAFVADQTQTVTQNYTLVLGNPQQGNYNLWGDVDGITIVAFVQKTSTKEIYQGAIASMATGVDELEANNGLLRVWPNPTTGMVSLRYGKALAGTARVEVFNVLGERVMDLNRSFANAGQTQTVDLGALDNGVYLLSVTADGVRSTSRINVNK